jgi:DNA (cytosine-5)-methyltransferase 1
VSKHSFVLKAGNLSLFGNANLKRAQSGLYPELKRPWRKLLDRLTTVSLFSGCGGADIGATRAGANIILANDNNSAALATYRKYQHLVASSSAEIMEGNIEEIKAFPACDLLLGCYPCQTFTMGGPRSPEGDPRSLLYRQFGRCIKVSNPKFFVTENVAGLAWLNKGKYLKNQLEYFCLAGRGYNISLDLVDAKEYGVPQGRKRVFIVGVRKDLALYYWFPSPTHGALGDGLLPWASHGEALKALPIEAEGEYYDYPNEPFSWWYMSRNRKRKWEDPSYAIQGNWRHVPLHPASPTMHMVESNLKDGFKQRWEFTGTYDHLEGHPERPKLDNPRRLSWRECAAIQGFPTGFEPVGSIASKYQQIGNATPPLLVETLIKGIVDGTALQVKPYKARAKALAQLVN